MPLSRISTNQIADDSVTNAKIGAGAITNTEVNASAGIVATKLGTMTTANMPSGSIVQCVTKTSANGSEHNNASWTTLHSDANALKITPTSSSNKIIVQYMLDRGNGSISGESHTLYRIITTINGSQSNYPLATHVLNISNSGYRYNAAGSFLGAVISPTTTSEVKFDFQSYVYSSKKAAINPYGHTVGYQALEVKA